ncbi:MAG TPA: LytTR family DNA-binding domain-containing protein [Cyclobacteriaceae bacterium]|nr:LytTR family DNA-binding domain-containing protein [Cyclobacteriaceae bacterium]
MNILIIEDEPQAAKRLETLVYELLPGARVLDKIDSVKKSVQWLKNNPPPDLALVDIQLADGISFQIFEQCEVKCPVIFTTAYDEYALKAFKVNSIDYILKPVDKNDLQAALKKLETLTSSADGTKKLLNSIGEVVQKLSRKYKERFVIKVGEHLRTIGVKDILYFHSQDKATFCHTADNRNHILDFTLEQLEDMIDPLAYFRVNRKYLVRAEAIQDIVSYTNSRLRLVLKNSTDNDVIVARERVQEFKQWLDR